MMAICASQPAVKVQRARGGNAGRIDHEMQQAGEEVAPRQPPSVAAFEMFKHMRDQHSGREDREILHGVGSEP